MSLVQGRRDGMAYDESTWSLVVRIFAAFTFLLALADGNMYRTNERALHKQERMILFGNPLAVFLFWPIYGPILFGRRVPYFLCVVGQFVRVFFRLIHSDLRLLCAFDAALGAAVGYFTGSALLGALIGGFAGVANYEIISKRVLNLIPR